MAVDNNAAGSDRVNPGLTPPPELESLVLRLNDAGYQVLETRPGDRGLVWTLAPHRSQVEFQLVGNDEVLRFLDHH